MATIVEVARLAGVSTATVSRVLNNTAVRPDLEIAVRRAIAELDYTPNRTARSLRRQNSEVIALILPDIENPFFNALARGVEDIAQEAGYSVVLCNSDDQPEKEKRYLQIADSEDMAGVIIAPASKNTDLAPLLAKNRALVVLDRPVDFPVDHVVFDNEQIGKKTTKMLLDRGFSRIACVTGPTRTITAVERANGWRAALVDAGLKVDESLLRFATFKVEGGRRAMRELLELENPPEAVLATNNLVGVGVLRALAEAGLSSDEVKVGIVGELPFATTETDNLSLLPQRPRKMGILSARMLLERIGGLTTEPRRIVQSS